jgi:hypothetical protein
LLLLLLFGLLLELFSVLLLLMFVLLELLELLDAAAAAAKRDELLWLECLPLPLPPPPPPLVLPPLKDKLRFVLENCWLPMLLLLLPPKGTDKDELRKLDALEDVNLKEFAR